MRIPKHHKRTERLLDEANVREYAETGDAYAQYCMGKIYRDGGIVIPDAENAKVWLEQAAEQNLSSAQYTLADLLLSNDLTVQDHNAGMALDGGGCRKRKQRGAIPHG